MAGAGSMAKARGKYAARGMALRAFGYPGLTAWANLCRTYGAGFVPRRALAMTAGLFVALGRGETRAVDETSVANVKEQIPGCAPDDRITRDADESLRF